MRKIFTKLSILIIGIILLTGCDLLKQKTEEKIVKEKKVKISINYNDINTMEKISKLVFDVEKETLKESDFSENKKSEISRLLVGSYDKTGTEMTSAYQQYFGKDKKVDFQNVKCFWDHGNPDENIIYIFDKEKDKYVYNEKHPGHGGGGKEIIGSEIALENITNDSTEYIFEAKVLFYGKAMCGDTGGCEYGKGYKSYEDAKSEKNALLDIDNSRNYWNEYELPTLQMDKVIADYRDKLDTYEFHFTKEDNNLIFTKYNKK